MLYETDAGDLIDFAQRWAGLGDAVAEQVADIVDNPQTNEVNPAAIDLARSRLQGLNQGIDLAMDEYLARCQEEPR
jgi:hypothetical protein